jgi:glutamate racemase
MNNPIGIFDSGVGGLTVANQIIKLLPNHDVIYFGDIAHLPYGDKSKEAIQEYSYLICKFLVSEGCKNIVVACNTASAFAFNKLTKDFKDVTLFNVIDPVVKYIADNYKDCQVGVIGTKGTIGSRIYPNKIKKLNKSLLVKSMATPLLVPLIEEGLFNTTISKAIIKNYLSSKSLKEVECLVLGCTHYPLVQDEIEAFYNRKNVKVINSAKVIARSICEYLNNEERQEEGKMKVYVSDYTSAFEKNARKFFGAKLKLEKIEL